MTCSVIPTHHEDSSQIVNCISFSFLAQEVAARGIDIPVRMHAPMCVYEYTHVHALMRVFIGIHRRNIHVCTHRIWVTLHTHTQMRVSIGSCTHHARSRANISHIHELSRLVSHRTCVHRLQSRCTCLLRYSTCRHIYTHVCTYKYYACSHTNIMHAVVRVSSDRVCLQRFIRLTYEFTGRI
jgi:hypothetical protein